MRIHDCKMKVSPLTSVEGAKLELVTWERLNGGFTAGVRGHGIDAWCEADTRGAAIVELADALKALGYELARVAFETAGAVRIPRPTR